MAVRFDAAADRLARTSGVIDYNASYTIMGWFMIVTDTNNYANIFALSDNSSNNSDFLTTNSDGTTFAVGRTSGGAGSFTINAGTALSLNTWYHGALVRDTGAGNLYAYLNGTLDATNSSSIASRAASTRTECGGATTGNLSPFNGRMYAVKAWQAALTAAEIRNEMNLIRPARFANIHLWTPLLAGSGERVRDYSGAGRDWTEGGTLTDEAPPPVSWGGRSLFMITLPPTLYTVSISGAVSPTGALIKQPAKLLTGANTPTGALAKQPAKLLTGAATPAGALIKRAGKLFTGATSPSGALVKQPAKVLSGAVSSAGALARRPAKVLTGATTPAGALVKQASKLLTGALSSSGAVSVIRTYSQALSGALSPSGALVKRANKLISGATTPAGALVKRANKVLSGALTSSGAVSSLRAYIRDFSGALTSSGALSKRPAKLASGAVAPGGTLTKQASKLISGALTSAGSVSAVRSLLQSVSGVLNASGTLIKSISKTLSGVLSAVGSLITTALGGGIVYDDDTAVFASARRNLMYLSSRTNALFRSARRAVAIWPGRARRAPYTSERRNPTYRPPKDNV